MAVDQLTVGGMKCKQPCNLIYEFTKSTKEVAKTNIFEDGRSFSRCGIFETAFNSKSFMITRATPGLEMTVKNL